MAEAKSRRETITRPRARTKADEPLANGELTPLEEPTATLTEPETPVRQGPPAEPHEPAAPPVQPRVEPPRSRVTEDDYAVFDEEINNRYEEIKRGSTHISELQSMTMPQLLKIAREEGLTDYTGLKKQDLIFKILKERVKQNGLMFGEGTL